VSAELVVASLQQQLREKDLKLTDIRLEALTSAHQLDHLRDAMNRMQVPPYANGQHKGDQRGLSPSKCHR